MITIFFPCTMHHTSNRQTVLHNNQHLQICLKGTFHVQFSLCISKWISELCSTLYCNVLVSYSCSWNINNIREYSTNYNHFGVKLYMLIPQFYSLPIYPYTYVFLPIPIFQSYYIRFFSRSIINHVLFTLPCELTTNINFSEFVKRYIDWSHGNNN